MRNSFMPAAVLALIGLSAIVPAASAQDVPPPPQQLVGSDHQCRKFYVFAKPVFEVDASGKVPTGVGTNDGVYSIFNATPPVDWASPDFDDGQWLVRPGAEFYHGIRDNKLASGIGWRDLHLQNTDPFLPQVAVIYQRSAFNLSKAQRERVQKLRFWMPSYRGGFVAYLNGKEIARDEYMPAEGAAKIEPLTPAKAYPAEAFFYRDSLKGGRPRPLDPRDTNCDQWKLRQRVYDPIGVPVADLRDGANVLAIEFHRAVYPAVCAKQELTAGTAGMGELRFEAIDSFVPGVYGRNATTQAATVDITRSVFDRKPAIINDRPGPLPAGDNDRLTPLRIVAAANGQFSGQVIVTCGSHELLRPTAQVSLLRRVGGAAVIGQEHCKIRFARPNPLWTKGLDQLGIPVPTQWKADAGTEGGTRYDCLHDAPFVGHTDLSVWLTVSVPKIAAAGRYEGDAADIRGGH